MSRHFPRRAGGLTIIQTMAILAILGVVLFFALSLLKKEMAPAATFKTLQGEQITTASLRGKVVMVNFWATSCSTCVQEMPEMVETYKKYRERGFEFYWEMLRRTDMIRFGKYEGIWTEKTNTDKNKRIFPIPQTAVDGASNLKDYLKQNAGY